MGGITSGIGIFSGIDTRSLIDQLISIEARPRILAQQRIIELKGQQAAFFDINSSLLALRTAAGSFNTLKTFDSAKATSSDEDVLSATASTGAAAGIFKLTVDRLVTTHQNISRGFADQDVSGVGASSFSFESADARLDSETTLGELHGTAGVERGKFRITDSAGGTAVIDVSKAVTVDDVLEAINSASGIDVTATINDTGDGLKIIDNTGTGGLVVEDEFGFNTATSLGIAGSGVPVSRAEITDQINGSSLVFLSNATPLSILNDGNGVSARAGGSAAPKDFEIVLEATLPLDTTESFDIVLGQLGENVPGEEEGETEFVVTEGAVSTIGGLIARIESQTEGKVTAEISADGRGITLRDATTGQARDLKVIEGDRSTAADIGLIGGTTSGAPGSQTVASRRLIAGLNTKLSNNLRGGQGVGAGTFDVTSRDGTDIFSVTVGADDTVGDIIAKINQGSGGAITASLNKAGNGIRIVDASTGGDLVIADSAGTVAADLNIATAGEANGKVDSGNLQFKHISGGTLLADLNAGEGIGTGSFKITDSNGNTATINVNSSIRTVDDLLAQIDGAALVDVSATLNQNGDGILIQDNAGGPTALKIANSSGLVGSRLKIVGESSDVTPGSNQIDGSFEQVVEFKTADKLEDVVDKINSANVGVRATIVNTGAVSNPFQVILTSDATGQDGRFIIDTGGFDLGLSTLNKGEDAVAFFGDANPAKAVLLTSSTNTLSGVVQGVTLDLNGTSDEAVEVNVTRDFEAIEGAIEDFVEAFNNVLARIDNHDRFNAETEQRGALLGDSTLANLRSNLLNVVQGNPTGVSGTFTSLIQVGVRFGQDGLEFDREDFREAFDEDSEGIAELFAASKITESGPTVLATDSEGNPLITTPNTETSFEAQGVAELIESLAERFTDSIDGLLTNRTNTLDTQIELQEDRIDGINGQLERKRARLEAQFLAMELALASIQSQSQSLGSIQSIG